jgi:hypothetical protein
MWPKLTFKINLSTIRTRNSWHLLSARAHGSCRNVLDVATSVHVIVKGHKKETVAAIGSARIGSVVRPRESV